MHQTSRKIQFSGVFYEETFPVIVYSPAVDLNKALRKSGGPEVFIEKRKLFFKTVLRCAPAALRFVIDDFSGTVEFQACSAYQTAVDIAMPNNSAALEALTLPP
jgi:hypothetical protein